MLAKWFAVGALLTMSCAAMAQLGDEDTTTNVLFRYTNDNGNLVVEQSIPPAAAAGGYEIITEQGRVLKKVPKALQGEDAAKHAERLRHEAQLAEWDAKLKRRYSSIKDIESAKKRSLSELSGNLGILRANLSGVINLLEEQQRRAGIRERNAQKIPQTVLDNIASLESERIEVLKQISTRQEELAKKAKTFDRDIERFRVILGETSEL